MIYQNTKTDDSQISKARKLSNFQIKMCSSNYAIEKLI